MPVPIALLRSGSLRLALPALATLAVVALALWLTLGSGGSQPVIPDGPTVDGRLFWGSVGYLRDGSSYQARCEADALVRVERDTITAVLEHGDRPEIKVGEKLDHDTFVDPSDYSIDAIGPPPTVFDLWVYRDEDEIIRTGCSPESTVIIDGISKTVEEWRAEGKIE